MLCKRRSSRDSLTQQQTKVSSCNIIRLIPTSENKGEKKKSVVQENLESLDADVSY